MGGSCVVKHEIIYSIYVKKSKLAVTGDYKCLFTEKDNIYL